MTEKEKMLAGDLYDASDGQLQSERAAVQAWMDRYNNSLTKSLEARRSMLEEALGSVGSRAEVRPPVHVDYGYNIHLGNGVFLNFNCVILDVVKVIIGAGTQIGPGVQILTADHPRDPEERNTGLEFGRPITIGRNVWIGGGALILPGVEIGDGALIGAGSVVTRSVAPGTTAIGNPARLK